MPELPILERAKPSSSHERRNFDSTPFDEREESETSAKSFGSRPTELELLSTIATDIIPRLVSAHRSDQLSAPMCAGARSASVSKEELDEMARLATCHDLNGALALVEEVCRQGMSLESVLLDLVAPSARLLGEQWKEDLRGFHEVTAGMGTLQQLVHVLSPSFAPNVPHRGLVVLTTAPGEQHTLGVYFVAEFLRRAGWGVNVDPRLHDAELLEMVASQYIAMVGVSVSSSHLLRPIGTLIEAIRDASCNPEIDIMLGGAADFGSFAKDHGVTLCTSDPREAVRALDRRATVRQDQPDRLSIKGSWRSMP